MPIGVVSDEDFDKEYTKPVPAPSKPYVHTPELIESIPSKGRGQNNVNVPDSLRKVIGEEANINGRQSALELAKSFGIKPSSVSAYSNGATSTASYNEKKSEILDHINRSKERISKKAKGKLMLALTQITEEKLRDAKVRDISSVAKDMSGIMKDMEPDKGNEVNPNAPKFVFYSPTFIKEEHFETIVVNE